jgi:hypothetical protein
MKTLFILLLSLTFLSFRPSTKEAAIASSNGFYVSVKDHTDRTYHEFIVESKDSANNIFNKYFETELELGNVDYPISIYNGKRDFYIARVFVFEKPNGKKDFKHLKYANVYEKKSKSKGRAPVEPAIFGNPKKSQQ